MEVIEGREHIESRKGDVDQQAPANRHPGIDVVDEQRGRVHALHHEPHRPLRRGGRLGRRFERRLGGRGGCASSTSGATRCGAWRGRGRDSIANQLSHLGGRFGYFWDVFLYYGEPLDENLEECEAMKNIARLLPTIQKAACFVDHCTEVVLNAIHQLASLKGIY